MRQRTFRVEETEKLSDLLECIARSGEITDPERTLLVAFACTPDTERVRADIAQLHRTFPGMHTLTVTMMGPLSAELTISRGYRISLLSFERSSYAVMHYNCLSTGEEQAAQYFARDLERLPDARGALFLTGGLRICADRFLQALPDECARLPLFGMPAGGWSGRDSSCFLIGLDGMVLDDEIVMVVFGGRELHLMTGITLGWKPFGREMEVTDGGMDGAVRQIDGQSPQQLYQRYLHLAGMPRYLDVCAFPLAVGTGENMTAQIPRALSEESFTYGIPMPTGTKVTLAYATESSLLQQSIDLANRVRRFAPQAALAFVCVNRRVFLGDELAQREIDYLREAIPSVLPGYGFGEVLRRNGQGGLRNNSIVVCAMREGEPDPAAETEPITDSQIALARSGRPQIARQIVTFLEETTRELLERTSYDEMTGLLNRAAIERAMNEQAQCVQGNGQLTALMFDLDNFKGINDEFGHDVGDMALTRVAELIRQVLGEDGRAGRWGGDEFFCISTTLREEEARERARRILELAAQTDFSPVAELTLSCGISALLPGEHDCRALYRRVDRAMYHSKRFGGNRVTVYEERCCSEISAPGKRYRFSLAERTIYEQTPFPLLICQRIEGQNQVILLSEGYAAMLGTSRMDSSRYLSALSKNPVHPLDVSRLTAFLSEIWEQESATLIYRRRIGARYHSLAAAAYRRQMENGTELVFIYCTDVNLMIAGHSLIPEDLLPASRTDEQGLYRFRRKERRIYESVPFSIAIFQVVDEAYRCLLVSDGACRLWGEEREDLMQYLNNRSYSRTHPEDAGKLMAASRLMGKQDETAAVCRMRVAQDDDWHALLFQTRRRILPDGIVLVMVSYTDLDMVMDTQSGTYSQYLGGQKDLLIKDDVTQLPTLRYFRMFAAGTISELQGHGRTPWIVFFDVRGMHSYNDHCGYEAGNALLRRIGAAVQEVFPGELCIRYTEDHFVLLTGATDVQERIEQVRERIVHSSDLIDLTAGLCRCDDPQEDPVRAIDRARLAVDFIHNDKRQKLRIYDEDIRRFYDLRDHVLGHCDEAIARGWIRVFYQPVVGTLSGRVTGVEALSRWEDPELGMLVPKDFIDTLEENHRLCPVDLYVIETVCRDMRMRQAEGRTVIPVSVNLSRHDLEVPDLHESINDILERYDIPRRLIHLEITETALMKNESTIQEHIRRFHEDGYQVWLDDFGSGYSSLATLQRFDFDVLKIDMMFLRRSNDKTPVVLADIVDMAKRLGMMTLAEGVETGEQYDFLHDIGCAMAQGYFFTPPKPIVDLGPILKEKGLSLETPAEHDFYSHIEKLDFQDISAGHGELDVLEEKTPVEIILDQDGRLSLLYANRPCWYWLRKGLPVQTAQDVNRIFNDPAEPHHDIMRRGFALAMRNHGLHEEPVLIAGEKGVIHIRLLAVSGDTRAFLMRYTFSQDPWIEERPVDLAEVQVRES